MAERAWVAIGLTGVVAIAVVGWVAPARGAVTSQLVTILDPSNSSQARVDSGRLRVGDGSGPLTVDGTVRSVPAATTLSGEIVVPSGSVNAVLTMSPPTCGGSEKFLVTDLYGSPSPTATFANGVHQAYFAPAWGASIPVRQQLADGSVRTSALDFAVHSQASDSPNGVLSTSASSAGGVLPSLADGRIPTTIEVFDTAGHSDFTVDVEVTGRCGVPPKLPA